MKTLNKTILFLIILVMGCTVHKSELESEIVLPSHEGEIRIVGSYGMMPLIEQLVAEYKSNNPMVNFRITPAGFGNAISYIFSDDADLVMVSSDLPEQYDSTAWIIPVARLSVVIIANNENPYWSYINERGLKKDELANLFTNENATWGELFNYPGENKASVYIRADDAGATRVLSKFLWVEKAEIKGIETEGEKKLIESVKFDPLALGYCNFIYSFNPVTKEFIDSVNIIPLDLNQNGRLDMKEDFYQNFETIQRAIWVGRYPCNLNRSLHFAASQKPATKEMVDFLNWIYTDGQKIIPKMGYMQLRSNEIKSCLAYIENKNY